MKNTNQEQKPTPLMEQYFSIKEQYPDALLFFQVGDFYELFFEDAKRAAAFLALTLTKRGKNKGEDIPLCGVPLHAASHYLAKLVRGGFKVVICSQLEKAQPGIMVKRGVTQVFTPGTLIDEQLLDEKSASYLLTIAPHHDSWGMVFSELLTAQIFATSIPAGSMKMLETELTRFSPDEIILPHDLQTNAISKSLRTLGYPLSFSQATEQGEIATAWVEQQFSATAKMKLQEEPAITQSLQTLYWYLRKNQATSLPLFKNIYLYDPEDYLILDASTQKNLELLCDNAGSRKHSLYGILDRAVTNMGSRTIKKWLQRPLVQEDSIKHRQEVIKQLLARPMLLMQLEGELKQLADLERIIGRIALDKAIQRDYQALKSSLLVTPSIKKIIQTELQAPLAQSLQDKISDLSALQQLLAASINDDPQQSDLLIQAGFHHELDSLRHLANNAEQEILALEQREIAATGITSLKIRFNGIAGYYFEITNSNEAMTPASYRHVQTLANRKRFTNDELTMLERNITRAQQDISTLEQEVFAHVKKEVYSYLGQLRQLAQSIAYLDGLVGLTRAAYDNDYVQPNFNKQRLLDVTASRHPVVEVELAAAFVKNNVHLDDQSRLLVITGPNMGGKSTYLRQVALTAIMAQIGSFIPATAGTLPIFDRIFTRIGSGDNLAQGKSTFLVEMEETATICTQATQDSLVILDEVGRGTSTYDGMALAQATIEYLVTKLQVSCLFATHYHELTELETQLVGIKNYHAEAVEKGNAITFTHRIKAGATTESFGVHVAELAQVPQPITKRAKEILQKISDRQVKHSVAIPAASRPHESCNPAHAQALDLVKSVTELDLDSVTPREALELLWQMQKNLRQK